MLKHEISTSYRWPAAENGLVDAIEFVRQKNGRAVAYLHTKEDSALHSKRLEVRTAIRARGWGTLSDFHEGQYVLRVSGLHEEEALLELLRECDCIHGTPVIKTARATQVTEPSKGFGGFIRDHSLTISGALATVGNALSIASGFARGREIGQIGQGASFAIADLPLAIAGERDDGRQFSDLLRHLKQHYIQEGIEIPQTASIYVETSDAGKSFGERAKDYLHRYANQIKCSMEVVAAGFTIHAGKNQKSSWKRYTPYVWGSGFLGSLLIPERKIDDEKYAEAGGLGKLWMRLQANPLMLGGMLGYSNTVATYASARNERKVQLGLRDQGKPFTQHYRWDFTIPSVMIGANGTYAMSNKTVGGDIRNEAMEADVYSVASQILNKQPIAKREAAFESTVNFLAERPEVRGNKAQVRATLRETMTKQAANPWFEPLVTPASTSESLHQAPATTTHAPNAPQSTLATNHLKHQGHATERAIQLQ